MWYLFLVSFCLFLVDVYPVRDRGHVLGLDHPVHLSGAVQWTDLAAVQNQLHNQQQVKITQHTHCLRLRVCLCVC